ncbi:MAG: DNA damage-inducible protein D, partial [Leptospirales bacterium]
MQLDLFRKQFESFEEIWHDDNGVEFMYARDLQGLLGYKEWRNFTKVLDRAKSSCDNSKQVVVKHFVDINKMVRLGSGSQRKVEDIQLTRYACYLVAQNGDSRKQEIAFAQNYFAVQTRKLELIVERLQDLDRLETRNKLKGTEQEFSDIIFERIEGGDTQKGFALGRIRSKGDEAFFGGHTTSEMKEKLNVPKKQPLHDYTDTVIMKGKDFASAMTNYNVKANDINGENPITEEHVTNNISVRRSMRERGIEPEEIPPREDIKKV